MSQRLNYNELAPKPHAILTAGCSSSLALGDLGVRTATTARESHTSTNPPVILETGGPRVPHPLPQARP